jgi:hypothetical protein
MRVTPDDAGSQEVRAGVELRRSFAAASAAAERRQTSALRFSARRARSAGEWQHSFAWLGQYPLRLSALRLLSFFAVKGNGEGAKSAAALSRLLAIRRSRSVWLGRSSVARIFSHVIAGLDPAIHAATSLARLRRMA